METKLTECEQLIMNVLWDGSEVMPLMEIIEALQERFQVNWSVQTVSTFLHRMRDKGYVKFYRVGRQNMYYPIQPKQEYFEEELERFTKLWGKLPVEYLIAMNKQKKLGKEEIEQLKKMLDSLG